MGTTANSRVKEQSQENALGRSQLTNVTNSVCLVSERLKRTEERNREKEMARKERTKEERESLTNYL